MGLGPPVVRLRIPPQHGVHLLAWGADPTGQWWALVAWERYVARGFETPIRLLCSAWTSSAYVTQIDGELYQPIPRVRLDTDPRWWPPPPTPRGGHYGLLQPDTPLDPPDGHRWCNPRYSKRH